MLHPAASWLAPQRLTQGSVLETWSGTVHFPFSSQELRVITINYYTVSLSRAQYSTLPSTAKWETMRTITVQWRGSENSLVFFSIQCNDVLPVVVVSTSFQRNLKVVFFFVFFTVVLKTKISKVFFCNNSEKSEKINKWHQIIIKCGVFRLRFLDNAAIWLPKFAWTDWLSQATRLHFLKWSNWMIFFIYYGKKRKTKNTWKCFLSYNNYNSIPYVIL